MDSRETYYSTDKETFLDSSNSNISTNGVPQDNLEDQDGALEPHCTVRVEEDKRNPNWSKEAEVE